ncbi:MAG: universal stress protein [Nitrosopumilaceae archaeon]|jgi:nucleotide-binding universal stress UspA family protein
MKVKRIMVCLDGSKHSLRGLNTAILLAKQSDATIVGIHSFTKHGAFTAVHTPKIKEDDWTNEIRGIMHVAKNKVEKTNLKFEAVVLAGHTAGYDLTTWANNPKNKIDHIVIGARGMGFPKEIFFGSTSNFILHKAKAPVTVIK